MKYLPLILTFLLLLSVQAPGSQKTTPADHLPPHIRQVTGFGERGDWSHDGKKILFLSKTFGDAMEVDVESGEIKNLTSHYPNYGYTRALYLPNGDILLSGPLSYDLENPYEARRNCYLFVLDKSISQAAMPLGVRCNEGPAVSRTRMHIAWPEWQNPAPGDGNTAYSQLYSADIEYLDGKPLIANHKMIIDGSTLPVRTTMEPQNFRPGAEHELTFSAYTHGGRYCDVMVIDVNTSEYRQISGDKEDYEEPEGIYADGTYTIVESDLHNGKGSRYIDLYKVSLDDKNTYERLTFFSQFPNFKSSNPVVSDDGRFISFQMARSSEEMGVGHGLFIYDIEKASK